MNTYSNYKIQNCKNTLIFISKIDEFRLRTIFPYIVTYTKGSSRNKLPNVN